MRNFKILALCSAFAMLLGGCGAAKYQKRQVTEDPAVTARFEALSKLGSPTLVAKAAASEIAADVGGAKPHVKVAQFAILEEISAQEGDLIYAYSLSPGWANLKNSDREKYLKFLQNFIDFAFDFHSHTIHTKLICHDVSFFTSQRSKAPLYDEGLAPSTRAKAHCGVSAAPYQRTS